jgi:hypothetical protein
MEMGANPTPTSTRGTAKRLSQEEDLEPRPGGACSVGLATKKIGGFLVEP